MSIKHIIIDVGVLYNYERGSPMHALAWSLYSALVEQKIKSNDDHEELKYQITKASTYTFEGCPECLDFTWEKKYCTYGKFWEDPWDCAPPPEMYNYLIESTGLDPSEILFIDDNLAYVFGAMMMGMSGVVFGDNKQLVKDLRKLGVTIPDRWQALLFEPGASQVRSCKAFLSDYPNVIREVPIAVDEIVRRDVIECAGVSIPYTLYCDPSVCSGVYIIRSLEPYIVSMSGGTLDGKSFKGGTFVNGVDRIRPDIALGNSYLFRGMISDDKNRSAIGIVPSVNGQVFFFSGLRTLSR